MALTGLGFASSMSDTQAAMHEFRFLDEKRKTDGLTQSEEMRWQELGAALGIDLSAFQPQGYYAEDGLWYPYPEGYDPNAGWTQEAWDAQQYAQQGYVPAQNYFDPNTGAYYPAQIQSDPEQAYSQTPQGHYDPSTGAFYPAEAYPQQPETGAWGGPAAEAMVQEQQAWASATEPSQVAAATFQVTQLEVEAPPPSSQSNPISSPGLTRPVFVPYSAKKSGVQPPAPVEEQPQEISSDEVMEITDDEVLEVPALTPPPLRRTAVSQPHTEGLVEQVESIALSVLETRIDISPHPEELMADLEVDLQDASDFAPPLEAEIPLLETSIESLRPVAEGFLAEVATLEVELEAPQTVVVEAGLESEVFRPPLGADVPFSSSDASIEVVFEAPANENPPLVVQSAAAQPVEETHLISAPSSGIEVLVEAPVREHSALETSVESAPASEPLATVDALQHVEEANVISAPNSGIEVVFEAPISGNPPLESTPSPIPLAGLVSPQTVEEANFISSSNSGIEVDFEALTDTKLSVEKAPPAVSESQETLAVSEPSPAMYVVEEVNVLPIEATPTASSAPIPLEVATVEVEASSWGPPLEIVPESPLGNEVNAAPTNTTWDAPLEIAVEPMANEEADASPLLDATVEPLGESAIPNTGSAFDLLALPPESAPRIPTFPKTANAPRAIAPPVRVEEIALEEDNHETELSVTVEADVIEGVVVEEQPVEIAVDSWGAAISRPTPAPRPSTPQPTPSAPMPIGVPLAGPGPSSPKLAPIIDAQSVPVSGEHRVILHTVEGQVKRGTIKDENLGEPRLHLSPTSGAPESIPTERVKAVFFMLAPGVRTPLTEGEKVRVTFNDGRQVAGFSKDHRLSTVGFFVVPADNRTNTERIFIFRHAVQSISVDA